MSRQRLVEMTVVIFGVLIALGLENLVEEVRLRVDARRLEVAFRADILSAVRNSWERQLVAPCQARTLSALTERAITREGGWDAAPAISNGSIVLVLPQPYRAPTRVWTTATFDRALGSEAFKRIPRERAETYSRLFASIEVRRELNTAEYLAISSLAPLAFSQAGIDAEVRADLLQNLSLVDRQRALALVQADQFINAALALEGGADIRAQILAYRSEFDRRAEQAEAGYGLCVDRSATDRLMKLAAS
ncbi:hypothetical protein [Brevundimonas sp.]|uniref:hypothetical protein n=1 Tax=Brevundimonas sp. TaxID=1871086 RepID=UPI002AB81BD1|nr:hypothetical protein [Brevundimonas sp.]MDZ4365385.1 hypothetical protein [Brevundimonas sp.]